MDEYGFGAAARAGLRMFEQCLRQSGRTMRMIERVTENDQIVVTTEQEAQRVRRLLADAGKAKTRVFAAPLTHNPMGYERGRSIGRTFYDHEWQRQWFEKALSEAARELEACQRGTSGTWPGEAKPEEPMAIRFEDWRI